MTIKIKYSVIAKNASRDFSREVLNTIAEECRTAVEELKKDSPVGISKERGQPDLKEGWRAGVAFKGSEIQYLFENTAPNAINRMEGRRPGRMPPIEAMIPWVTAKLKPEPSRIRQVAFLVARKIGRQGTVRYKRNFKQINPETGEPAKNSAIDKANQRILKRLKKDIAKLRFLE